MGTLFSNRDIYRVLQLSNFEYFRAPKLSTFDSVGAPKFEKYQENFRSQKISSFESFEALKLSKLTTESTSGNQIEKVILKDSMLGKAFENKKSSVIEVRNDKEKVTKNVRLEWMSLCHVSLTIKRQKVTI